MAERILLVLWTTSECNLSCKYCYAAAMHDKRKISFETAVRAIEMLKDRPMKIQFSGGEPLMNFELVQQVHDYIKEKNYNASFQMQTNATLIDRECALMLKKMKVALGVSLDGTVEINERLRGKTAYAVEGIHALAKAGVMVNVNCVVTSLNVDSLADLVNFSLYLGNVGGIGLDLLRNAGRMKQNLNTVAQPENEQLSAALHAMNERSTEIYEQFGKRIAIREIEEARHRLRTGRITGGYCYASCGRSLVVLPDGRIFPCGSLVDMDEYCMGNVEDGRYKSVSLTGSMAGNCIECKFHKVCPGGCPSRMLVNHALEPQLNSLDCVMKKTAFEIAEAGMELS